MENNPIEIFDALYQRNRKVSTHQRKGAVCISTTDSDGYPDGRFLDLKEVTNEGLVLCTDATSNKGESLANNAKASLTVWWENISTQIRIKGITENSATRAPFYTGKHDHVRRSSPRGHRNKVNRSRTRPRTAKNSKATARNSTGMMCRNTRLGAGI